MAGSTPMATVVVNPHSSRKQASSCLPAHPKHLNRTDSDVRASSLHSS